MTLKKKPGANITPAMRQYLEIKERLGDAIVFFRMGDFYEMFYEDAVTASKVLGIALTSRDRAKQIPMCGFPYHASSAYIKKLILNGFKVAVCEQVEEAGEAKGPLRREVVRVITPGTALEDDLLEPANNNFIAAINFAKGIYGLSCMDLSTGEFMVTEIKDIDGLIDELMRLNPLEALVSEESGHGAALRGLSIRKISALHAGDFGPALNVDRLCSHFNVSGLEGFGCENLNAGIGAAGALLHYIKDSQRSELPHIRKLTPYLTGDYMLLDRSTWRNLELTENNRGGSSGTLLSILDKTATAMGARLLRKWMARPLLDIDSIKARHNAVDELLIDMTAREALSALLKDVYDLQRLSARVSMGRAAPRDLIAMKDSLKKISHIKEALAKLNSPLLYDKGTGMDTVAEAVELIEESIKERPPLAIKDGGVIKDGFKSELDELRKIGAGGKDRIAALESEEREKTGIHALKVGYNRVFGYYIEVTRANLGLVPPEYTRKQTLVNAERFITEDLKLWEGRILGAEDRALELEAVLYREVIEGLRPLMPRVRETAERIAELDVLISFCLSAVKYNYTKPLMTAGSLIRIEGGRHPVVEVSASEGFVSNDLSLDSADEAIIILTGPNMAGKSTFLRQNALIVYMAQLGSFVPAHEAELALVDRIFTRIGASDNLRQGQSTFMVEMNETANILNNATSKSLVILDEIGRGTSTFDGLSIAWAVVEYLHDHFKAPPKTLFATHYFELTDLSLTKQGVKNYNMAVKEWEGSIIFLRKVLPGQSASSYGIHVAALAGIPAEVLTRARQVLKNLESAELTERGLPRLASHVGNIGQSGNMGQAGSDRGVGNNAQSANIGRAECKGMVANTGQGGGMEDGGHGENPRRLESGANLLGPRDSLKEEIRAINLDSTTPIEALNLLHKLKEKILDT